MFLEKKKKKSKYKRSFEFLSMEKICFVSPDDVITTSTSRG